MGIIKDLFDQLDIGIGIKNHEDGSSDVSVNIKSKPSKNYEEKIKNFGKNLKDNKYLAENLLSEDTQITDVSYDEGENNEENGDE